MPAKIIDNYKTWFLLRRPKSEEDREKLNIMLAIVDRRAASIEHVLSQLKVHRSESEIDTARQELLARYRSEDLFDELVESITHSVPEYWRSHDLFYRAVLLEYKHLRRGL